MNNHKPVLKDDINFLEYPNWLISKRNSPKTYTIEKDNGEYVISTAENIDRLPDRLDKIILYYLMSLLMKNDFEDRIVDVSRYQIAKEALGSFRYDRIMLGLRRWHKVSIDFNGTFYDGDGYSTRSFHIIDDIILKNNNLKIFFNVQFLEQIRASQYFKLINFNEYKRLKKPTSARLYEILVKTFKDRGVWHINIIKLAEKLTIEKRKNIDTYYPSDVIVKLTPAVNEINKKTDLKIKFNYNKETQICTFTKVKQVRLMEPEDKSTTSLPEDDNFKSLIVLIPKEHCDKKTILEAIASSYKKYGFDYVARNIKYTNRHCKGNYRAYLNKALKEDWGLAIQEDEENKQETIKEQEKKRQQEREALKQQKELKSQVREHIETLSLDELETLREEAISRLDEEAKKSAEKFGKLEFIVRVGMEEIVGERLTAI